MYKLKGIVTVPILSNVVYSSKNITIRDRYMVILSPEWNGMSYWREGTLTLLKDSNGTYLPITWKDSLVHDVLYGLSDINLTRKDKDKILYYGLRKYWSWLECQAVYRAVRIFGGNFDK